MPSSAMLCQTTPASWYFFFFCFGRHVVSLAWILGLQASEGELFLPLDAAVDEPLERKGRRIVVSCESLASIDSRQGHDEREAERKGTAHGKLRKWAWGPS